MSSLAGLVANYGDSDEEHDENGSSRPLPSAAAAHAPAAYTHSSAAIHPPPIPHCPWSACYDEGSGFTYYWNQQTNAVTWEAPPEYLLALKLAQQQLNTSGSTEVSAEEWQLYQQALAEKQNVQNKMAAKASILKPTRKVEKPVDVKSKKDDKGKKRPASEDEEEKIELITSYYNSDSESNDESESPVKSSIPPKPQTVKPQTAPKQPVKKQKKQPTVEYGPSLPPNQNYTVPIGPELPPKLTNTVKSPEHKTIPKDEGKSTPNSTEIDESIDENALLNKLKDKAKLLEKLGGELPSELKKIIRDENSSGTNSPIKSDGWKEKILDTNIDDLLDEIEKKELPKVKSKSDEQSCKSNGTSARNSPRSTDTPPREEIKPLFPSSKVIAEEPEKPVGLFPSAANIRESSPEKIQSSTPPPPAEKKPNMYLSDVSEVTNVNRKKLRISNSVLPERPKAEAPSYTTKYSSHIEGFSSERTGLGFSKEEESGTSPKATISYGNGLMFTKGETLNEEKRDEDLDDMMELVEAKLKYLNQLQPCVVTPVAEMLIQMQTLMSAFRAGALSGAYWRRWVAGGTAALAGQEARAAPPGWALAFQRSEGRYRYERADGHTQWEYPAPAPPAPPADMDICTTPPHSTPDKDEVLVQPPLPASPPPPPPPPAWQSPPQWADPPPPGTDDPPPLPAAPAKQEIGDELASFYSDIAELEKQAPPSAPQTGAGTPSPPPPPPLRLEVEEKKKEEVKPRKKTKVKISSSVGLKHKSVSNLVAKWQQVADEIHSDS
ncbi:formin-binding protein 4-like [Pectinophora gossypiella]|nr:formin-binding protein 4-like [Pectinophora gossypiella]